MMTETVYMTRNKESGCYLDFEGYECECISYAKQWQTVKDAIWFIEECDEPEEFEVVEIEVVYKELRVINDEFIESCN